MPSRMAAAIFTLLILMTPGAIAYGQEEKLQVQDMSSGRNTTATESKESKENQTKPENSKGPVHHSTIPSRKRKSRIHNQRERPPARQSIAPFTLVSSPPEYLSGEANVTVKGNENPI